MELFHGADLLLLNEDKIALVLQYSPGKTPLVLHKAKGRQVKKFISIAQEQKIPIVENLALDGEGYKDFKEGGEIPEKYYHQVALALALIYKTTPSPAPVRFVKPYPPVKLTEKDLPNLVPYPVSIETGTMLAEKREILKIAVDGVRQRILVETGIPLPEVNIQERQNLKPNGFEIKLRDVVYLEGEMELASEEQELASILAGKLKQVLTSNSYFLLGYVEVENLVTNLKKTHSSLVKELFPANFTVSALRVTLKNLLREQIPIKDLPLILESILENISRSIDPDLLTEYVRAEFSRYLCQKFADSQGVINALLLDPQVENVIMNSFKIQGGVSWLDLSADDGLKILTSIGEELKKASGMSLTPVLLCSPNLRRLMKRLTEQTFPDMAVLSYSEIVPLSEVRSIGSVSIK